MADKAEKSNGGKRQNMVKNIIALFKFTYKEDKKLPWLAAGAFIAPIVVAIVLGIVFHWSVIAWILLMITAVMLGALFFTMVLTNRADRVGYATLEGQPGAAIGVLGNISKAGIWKRALTVCAGPAFNCESGLQSRAAPRLQLRATRYAT